MCYVFWRILSVLMFSKIEVNRMRPPRAPHAPRRQRKPAPVVPRFTSRALASITLHRLPTHSANSGSRDHRKPDSSTYLLWRLEVSAHLHNVANLEKKALASLWKFLLGGLPMTIFLEGHRMAERVPMKVIHPLNVTMHYIYLFYL